MTPLRRSALATTALAVLLSVAGPAAASDLAEMLDEARDATYTATRLTVSVWGDETIVVRERVEHSHGSEIVRVDEHWSMVGDGRAITMNESPEGIAFMTSAEPIATDRYTVTDAAPVSHMRRTCELITVNEGDTVRARVVVDDLTGAPLITYLYDADGRVFRTVSLSEFKPHRTYEWPEGRTDGPVEIVMNGENEVVPDEVAGYALVDVFPGPASSEQGFFSDGLFAFSLFALPAAAVVEGFEAASTMITSAGIYEVAPTAHDVRVHWSDGTNDFVLVGNVPPDHLESVLDELPAPQNHNMLMRWWHRLFG